ncbi:5469_t:CDS:2, partial [Dentiscutata erythropus]
MSSLQPLFKDIKLYFEETPFEEWSHLHFLETFKPVILSNLESTKRQDKGTWLRRFKECLEKISADEAYSNQERNYATHLSNEKPSSFVDIFFDAIEREKQILYARQEADNKTDIVCQNTIIDALHLLETVCKERTEAIANSLKQKSDGSDKYNIVNITEMEVKICIESQQIYLLTKHFIEFSTLDAKELFDNIARGINITISLPDNIKQYFEKLLSGDIINALSKLDQSLVDNSTFNDRAYYINYNQKPSNSGCVPKNDAAVYQNNLAIILYKQSYSSKEYTLLHYLGDFSKLAYNSLDDLNYNFTQYSNCNTATTKAFKSSLFDIAKFGALLENLLINWQDIKKKMAKKNVLNNNDTISIQNWMCIPKNTSK